ncbi:MAG: DUF6452 family protein [Mangrovibacterium sp.]
MRKILSFIFSLCVLAACEEVYDIPPQSQMQINFYNYDTEEAQQVLLSVKGVDNDSIWTSGTTTSSFVLPLGNSGSDNFVMLIDSIADTLQVNYTTELDYESMATGFYYNYNIQSVRGTKHKTDSIALIDTVVIDLAHENIQIFLNDSTGYTSD